MTAHRRSPEARLARAEQRIAKLESAWKDLNDAAYTPQPPPQPPPQPLTREQRNAAPDWRPGASVTLTATCPGPAHDGIGGEYYCDRGCNTGKVPVGSAVIADLVPVVAVSDTGYPDGAPDLFAYVSKAGALRIVDRIAKTDTFIAYKVVCAPGDTLARLETP